MQDLDQKLSLDDNYVDPSEVRTTTPATPPILHTSNPHTPNPHNPNPHAPTPHTHQSLLLPFSGPHSGQTVVGSLLQHTRYNGHRPIRSRCLLSPVIHFYQWSFKVTADLHIACIGSVLIFGCVRDDYLLPVKTEQYQQNIRAARHVR